MAHLKRRLVMTGHDAQGLGRVMSDRELTTVGSAGLPGSEMLQIWGADRALAYPDDGSNPTFTGMFPLPGGARLGELYLPPHATEHPAGPRNAAGDGLYKPHPDIPGMHCTASTDLIIIVSGKCHCRLDEETVTLGPGDVLVQNGTMHAWSNPYDEPCRFIAVILGAENGLCG
jgi:hypothetical protein